MNKMVITGHVSSKRISHLRIVGALNRTEYLNQLTLPLDVQCTARVWLILRSLSDGGASPLLQLRLGLKHSRAVFNLKTW